MKTSYAIRLLSLTVAISLVLLSSGAFAAVRQGVDVTVTGSGVKIEGASATTGATFMSGNRLTTDKSSSANLSINGSRITVNGDSDVTITMDGSNIRVNVTCGSVTVSAASGTTITVTTPGDTNVNAMSGAVSVNGNDLAANQTQRFNGGVTVTTTGGSAEVNSLQCTCKCLPGNGPVSPTVATPGLSGLAIAAIIAGAAVAVAAPVAVIASQNNAVSNELPAVSVSSAA